MRFHVRRHWRLALTIAASLALAAALTFSITDTARSVSAKSSAGPTIVTVSSDPYTNSTSQHKTEVEPDSYAYGSTIVFAFQVSRYSSGGADDTGWATSTDGGKTWQSGFLPGITSFQGGGPYARASDPTVAYDAVHGVWMISSLALVASGKKGVKGGAVVVNRSTDGIHWGNPVTVATIPSKSGFFDKDWIVCYSPATPQPSSVSSGHCYVEWDLANKKDHVVMSTSTDGGQTWSPYALIPGANGLGGQPLIQPGGTVIVPFQTNKGAIAAFTSTDGGASWSAPVTVAQIQAATDPGSLRSPDLPSAEIDDGGTVYVVWDDCRFEAGCATNDIVMSTSANGVAWSAVQRIPADPVGSGADHFIPGIGVDTTTGGSGAHLAVTYYYFPNAACTTSTCDLSVGYITSTNGGASWSAATTLASGMNVTWLANAGGYMVGDYISTSIAGGSAFPIVALASAPSGGLLDEYMATVTGLAVSGGTNATASARLVPAGGHALSAALTAS